MIKWKLSEGLTGYEYALNFMQSHVEAVINNEAEDLIWLLEHDNVITAGTSAKEEELLSPDAFKIFNIGRGGKYTYHGPGQRIIYPILNLKTLFKSQTPDLRLYIKFLEDWVIATLQELGIKAETRENRIGIWVIDQMSRERKIASIGVRVRKWVAFHGIAINLYTNLKHFDMIIPCGIREFGVTSLKELGVDITLAEFDKILMKNFNKILENYVEMSRISV